MKNIYIFHIACLLVFHTTTLAQELDFFHYQNPKKNKIKSVTYYANNSYDNDSKILGNCKYDKKGKLTDSTDQHGSEFKFRYGKNNELLEVENKIFNKTESVDKTIYHLIKWYKTIHFYENNLLNTTKHFENDTLVQIISYTYKNKKPIRYLNKNRKAVLIGIGYYEHDDGNLAMEEYFNAKSQKQFRIKYRYNKKGDLNYRTEQWYNPKSVNSWEKISSKKQITINEQLNQPYDNSKLDTSLTITKKITIIEKGRSNKAAKMERRWYVGVSDSQLSLTLEQLSIFDTNGILGETRINHSSTNTYLKGKYQYQKNKLLEKIVFTNINSEEEEFEILYKYEYY